jgi:quinol monooxygenase YgiN
MRFALAGAAFLFALSCCPPTVCAQESTPTYGPSKFLVIQREFTKPGRDGAAHQATEAGFLRAAAAGKAPFHYTAFTSMTGPNRALFLSGYDSMEAVEAERKSMSQALQTSLDKAMIADGDLLSGTDESVWMVDADLSQNTNGPRVGSRYMVFREFVIKPGHTGEWEQVVKLVLEGYKKADTGAHWSTYRMIFGNSTGPTYLVLTSMKSMSELDAMFAADPKFMEAMGEDGMKKLESLEASCVESSKMNFFIIDPKMSIPTDQMIKAEPDFWKVKPMATSTVAKKPAAGPKAASGQ